MIKFSPSHIISAANLDRNFDYIADYLLIKSVQFVEEQTGEDLSVDCFYEAKQIVTTDIQLSCALDLIINIGRFIDAKEDCDPDRISSLAFKLIGIALQLNGFTEEQNYEPQMEELNEKEQVRAKNISDTKLSELTDNQKKNKRFIQ